MKDAYDYKYNCCYSAKPTVASEQQPISTAHDLIVNRELKIKIDPIAGQDKRARGTVMVSHGKIRRYDEDSHFKVFICFKGFL